MDRGENSCLVEVEREGGTVLRVENPNFETIEQCSAPQYDDPSLYRVFLLRPRNQPNLEKFSSSILITRLKGFLWVGVHFLCIPR